MLYPRWYLCLRTGVTHVLNLYFPPGRGDFRLELPLIASLPFRDRDWGEGHQSSHESTYRQLKELTIRECRYSMTPRVPGCRSDRVPANFIPVH
jgi:hypothetical protein